MKRGTDGKEGDVVICRRDVRMGGRDGRNRQIMMKERGRIGGGMVAIGERRGAQAVLMDSRDTQLWVRAPLKDRQVGK